MQLRRRQRILTSGLLSSARHRVAMAGVAAVVLTLGIGIPFTVATVGSALPPAGPPPAQPLLSADVAPADADLLYRAEQFLIQNCMRRHGFTYWLVPPASSTSGNERFPDVIDDAGWAARNGFGSDPDTFAGPDPNFYYVEKLPEDRRGAYSTALNGPQGSAGIQVAMPQGFELGHSTQGCKASAEGSLYGDYPTWFAAVNVTDSLPTIWQADARNDPKYQRVVIHWSACMHDRGYSYASPDAARQAFSNAARPPDPAEVRAAVTEAGCANSTDLAAVAHQLDTYYATRTQLRYGADVRTYLRLRHAAIPRAREIASS
jgi:hypothetical protein